MNATQNDDKVISNALADALDALGKDTGGAIAALKRRAAQNRRMLWALVATATVTVITLGIMVATMLNTRSTAREVSDIQQRTSDKVLCPLYGAFLAAANNPIPDNIKNNPAQLAERERAFTIIRQGADELGCKNR